MKYNIPFFSLKRQWANLEQSILPQLHNLLKQNQYIGGPYVSQFETHFKHYTGAAHAISCNSGTDALWLALKALNIKADSIVLTTPFSFIASSSEIVAHLAHPLFIDVDESYNICPQKIENWLKSNAKNCNGKTFHTKSNRLIEGIIVVDLFGQCADFTQIKSIAKEWNLWIIEDACQAVGAHINNQKAGTFGDISCFSLYPTKNLGVCGDGGIMTTNNADLAETLKKIRNHGRASHYEYECYGINSRLDAIQALIGTEKLKRLDEYNNRRREIAQQYTEQLSQIPGITVPKETSGHHVYHQYCILLESQKHRDALRAHLTAHNIGTNIFYPKALNEISYLIPEKMLQTECPNNKRYCQTILALPIWPELTDDEVAYVCGTIRVYRVRQALPRATAPHTIERS